MPTHSDDAIVLTRFPFRERDLIAVLLSRGSGQVRVLAHRARGARRVVASTLEPLSRVRLTYYATPNAELARLVESETVRAAYALAERPEAWAAGQVVAELALLYVQPGQRQEAAFRLVDSCLTALAGGAGPLVSLHYAELWFLRLAGMFPSLRACAVCGADSWSSGLFYDLEERACLCPEHRSPGAWRLTAAALHWLDRASRVPLEQIVAPAPVEAAEWLATLRRHFTERELQSMRYLKRLLAEGRTPGA